MNDGTLPNAFQTLQEILDRWPRTVQVFIDLHTACVGCPMARFCSLDDVATNYRLDRDRLIQALQEPVPAVVSLGG